MEPMNYYLWGGVSTIGVRIRWKKRKRGKKKSLIRKLSSLCRAEG